jgi:hypothetical protein
MPMTARARMNRSDPEGRGNLILVRDCFVASLLAMTGYLLRLYSARQTLFNFSKNSLRLANYWSFMFSDNIGRYLHSFRSFLPFLLDDYESSRLCPFTSPRVPGREIVNHLLPTLLLSGVCFFLF